MTTQIGVWSLRNTSGPTAARALAQAYIVKGRYAEAAFVLEEAAERPGPIGDALREDAQNVRSEIAFRNRLKAAAESRKP